ncbi:MULTISPECIES: oxidoreductase [Asticcacaulis]|uniref:oxidoreductase n=1 Tax=Asticcacaulis TaxID=76890 RepID=UPI001AE6545A|nr:MULTISPECIES: oxidoreductase [Asticcacaulis]MBP2159505.1 NAD(P)-dependent dehydrogenase (short-subunit alcohol dehydrogenase family) [Asticcacaulis solisilvae]MDR6800668.1 NAD(P)-dependent dehydrogenase (short-subunit alcohol dehydrogenase family) [Asticcacaulis sp. BE141]
MSNDKVIVITGASSGIGEATARLLAQKGFRVFAGARRAPSAPLVPNLEFGRLDVTDEASVTAFIDWVLSEAGKIDVLINNAGVSLVGPVEKTSIEEAKALFDTNVFGPLRMMRAVLPSMRQARQGLIINLSSVLGFLPAPFMGLYASSKHALEGMSESLDHEVREFNVRVVLLEPSFTNTNLDTNSAHVSEAFGIYAGQVDATTKAVVAQIKSAPQPISIARKILSVINGPYRLRQPADGQAKLLSILRRFMPASAIDSSLRKSFGFKS